MSPKRVHLAKKLQLLELNRRYLAKQIDNHYLQDNISKMLELEAIYEGVIRRISNIQSILNINDNLKSTS
jgi:hypothetical protein